MYPISLLLLLWKIILQKIIKGLRKSFESIGENLRLDDLNSPLNKSLARIRGGANPSKVQIVNLPNQSQAQLKAWR